MTTWEGKLHIDSWDESPYREFDDGRKFTEAKVTLSADPSAETVSGDSVSALAFETLMYYRSDGTSQYTTLLQLTATLGGREGTFVLAGEGSYAEQTARIAGRVVEGSGTGGLVGVTGSLESASTHEDYPYMPLTLRYELG